MISHESIMKDQGRGVGKPTWQLADLLADELKCHLAILIRLTEDG